ncbi:hypothetical protein [Legionella cardiaca]|uniref:Mannosyltransferase n=1 Tax=Legionella cardiaca TaxID=1071983 RepID=A0ABY8AS01_9GAMM|nr:hypothetical protein [Legionella cardiaca]WED42986.1 hypothetical protein PXX05_13965 [Legionella cardiaca]
MNKDLLNYKSQFITVILLLGYTFLHIRLTGRYVDATFDQLLDFSARLPFGQRVLMPAIANGLSFLLPLTASELFTITEFITNSLFYVSLTKLLCQEFSPRQAQGLSWLFFLLLPLVTVINYRFSITGEAAIYYPYDSASLFFMATAFLLCLRERWIYFIPLLFLATFNRESSFLLVLMIPALHWDKLRTVVKPLVFSLLTFILARIIILFLVQELPGQLLEFYFRNADHTHFEVNLSWLFNEEHILLFIFGFAGLPLFWFGFYDYIPPQYRPLRYIALVYFLGLLVIGNFMEARIFIEIVVLLYLPVCVAMRRWAQDLEPFSQSPGVLPYVERYFVLGVLLLTILFHKVINPVIVWFAR